MHWINTKYKVPELQEEELSDPHRFSKPILFVGLNPKYLEPKKVYLGTYFEHGESGKGFFVSTQLVRAAPKEEVLYWSPIHNPHLDIECSWQEITKTNQEYHSSEEYYDKDDKPKRLYVDNSS